MCNHNIQYLLLFRSNSVYPNVPQRNVIRAVPVLFDISNTYITAGFMGKVAKS